MVFCPRAGLSLLTQAPRLQFCPKAGLPPQTQEPSLQFYYGRISAVSSCCFRHPTLSLAFEQTLKVLRDPRGTKVEVGRVDLANWDLQSSPKFTTGVKYQFHQGFWPDQRSRNPNQRRLQFYYGRISAVASCCFQHPTLSLAFEQTVKDLKDPRGTKVEVRRVDLANWGLQSSPKFTTGVKYQYHQGFWPDQRSGNPNQPSPPN